jgi:adenylate cyclase
VCARCGDAAGPEQRFCGACGAALDAEQEGERKQLTVLFADVQGSMDLQEALDPERWAAIIGRVVEILADGVRRFGGTVDKFTGDGVMALFGAPVAQEDHARRACHAACWLSAAVAEYADEVRRTDDQALHVRLGLNSGEVVVGRVGRDLRLEPTALGHTVGLAQRMESIAEPGRPYLTENTARLVERWFSLTDLGRQSVKGARQPLRVYALDGPRSAPPAARAASPLAASRLVGRAHELDVLAESLRDAMEGRFRVVGVIGEAGVGKSRLCQEFIGSVEARGVTARRTAGVSHGGDVPLLPILSLLRDYFRIGDGESPGEAREKVARRVLALDPALEETLPILYDLLEVGDPAHPPPALSPEVRMKRIFEALRRVMELRSEREVLVLLIEDLHWFDPQSARFLEELLESYAGTRTLVVTNFRPEFSAAWTARAYYRPLPLAPLREDAVAELLAGLLGGERSMAELLEFVLERTGGNPFFVEELVRTLVEDGTLAGRKGSYRLARPLDEVRVPASVHAVLAARIDRLRPEHKAVLQTAAVIGRSFAQPLLAKVTPLDAAALQETLLTLCGAELLQVVRREPVVEYRFWHPLTQEVAYTTPLASRRAALHAAVAQALIEHEPDRLDELAAVLAWHWERAGRPLEAARWNLRAGEFAVRTDLAAGQRRWRAAAEMLAREEQTAESREIGARARTRLLQFGARTGMDPAEAERLYAEGRALAEALDDLGMLGVLMTMAGSAKFWRGDVQGALVHVQEVAALGDRTDDPDLQTALWFGLGFVRAYAATPPETLAATDRVLAAAAGEPERGAALMGYSPLARTHQVRGGTLARAGRLADAAAEIEMALAVARPRNETDTVAWALAELPHLEWLRGDGNAGASSAAEALRLAEETGNVGALVLALDGLALAHLRAGEPVEAVGLCERALAEARGRRSGLFAEARLLIHLSNGRLAAYDPVGALAAAREATALARRRRTRTDECEALLARARARRAAGETAEAVLDDLAAALTLARDIGAVTYEPFVLEERARARADAAELRAAADRFAAIGASGHHRRLEHELASAAAPARARSARSR